MEKNYTKVNINVAIRNLRNYGYDILCKRKLLLEHLKKPYALIVDGYEEKHMSEKEIIKLWQKERSDDNPKYEESK